MTIEKISSELFEKLVGLAAMELTPQEAQYLHTEMNHQLVSLTEFSQIPLDEDIKPSLRGVNCVGAGPRTDEWKTFERPERIVEQAPASEDGMIAVPDVAHGKGDR